MTTEAVAYAKASPPARAALARALLRELFFRAAAPLTPTLEAVWPSGRFMVATADVAISRYTFIHGPFGLQGDLDAVAYIRDVLGVQFSVEGGEVLEAGANIGTGSVIFITAMGAQRVHAFEPAPENFRLLQQTVLANGLQDRIATHQIALSNAAGVLRFELSPKIWGDHRVSVRDPHGPDDFDESERGVIEVPATTIDSLVADGTIDLDKVRLAWVDIQGHEGFLLEGARSLLSTPIPIVIEFWPYGLSRSGGLESFIALIQQHRTHFLNVNDAQFAVDGRTTRERLEPVASLATLGERYFGRDPDHADLILFALPA